MSSILDLFPLELIIRVLSHMGYRDLLSCTLVCRLFHAVVRQNASLQYAIELAVTGMQSGPPSAIGHAERLRSLRESQAAWNQLKWTASKDVRMLSGSLYELYGGVLVQSTQTGGLVFRRLPSQYRGIEEHVWSLDPLDIRLRDFTLEPAQDLLVLIAQPVLRLGVHRARTVLIHLRSLTTGTVHPLATNTPVLVHDVDVQAADMTFMIQVHSDHVAVHFISQTTPSELVVWNWKTGQRLLNTYSSNLMAVGFLTKRLILVGGFGDLQFSLSQPRLFVIDLESTNGERTKFDEVEYLCAFLYPTCYPWVRPLNFLIRSDPCADWSPHPSVQVPFSIGPGPRLYIVTVWLMLAEEVSPLDLFILSNTFLDHINSLGKGETRHHFEWSEWGPAGTRMITQAPHSHVWVCYMFGTKFSAITTTGPQGSRQRQSRTLEVWDFNQLGLRREMDGEEKEGVELHVGGTSMLNNKVFVGEVQTRLPYRVFRRKLDAPTEGGPVFTEAMCSEDNVVLVDSQGRNFRILTF